MKQKNDLLMAALRCVGLNLTLLRGTSGLTSITDEASSYEADERVRGHFFSVFMTATHHQHGGRN